MKIRRGDVIFCSIGDRSGSSIQGGDRPVICVSNDRNNKHSTVFTGVPLTTKVKKNLPTHVKVLATENRGLTEDSTALCEQVTVLSCGCILNEKYGKVNEKVMEQITRALQVQLGM